jgi:hypothetical protein
MIEEAIVTITRAIDADSKPTFNFIGERTAEENDFSKKWLDVQQVERKPFTSSQDVFRTIATQSSAEWAAEQWAGVELGDERLNRRALHVGAAMAAHPAQSLPQQMDGDRASLDGAYRLLNHPGVSLDLLSQPHWEQTQQKAREQRVVLFVQDTTHLDYTHLSTMEGLGPIGDGNGRGLLLHSTLGVVPRKNPQVLGLAHQQVVLRQPADESSDGSSPEGKVWAQAAEAIGSSPEDVWWVHVGDRGSDDFRFMNACRDKEAHFLIRVRHNRLLEWDQEDIAPERRKLIDYAQSLPTQHRYSLEVPASHERPARTAQMRLAWTQVTIPPPQQAPPELSDQSSITAWVIRVWEVNAPPEAEPIEWILITSIPTKTVADAKERVRCYTFRWMSEDYHQCLKTGCDIEHRQFDHGHDIRRLLGICGPIAARLLQLRQVNRLNSQVPAVEHVPPLMVKILTKRLEWDDDHSLTMGDFWNGVAQLGGYLGRPGDGPPGWKTIWRGWRQLNDLVTGARLFIAALADQGMQSGHGLRFKAIPDDRFH